MNVATIRNCDGPPRPPELGPPIFHPKIPVSLLTRVCPMRSLRDPAVMRYLPVWLGCRRYRALPEAGGLLDQDAQTMEALDAMENAFGMDAPGSGSIVPPPSERGILPGAPARTRTRMRHG